MVYESHHAIRPTPLGGAGPESRERLSGGGADGSPPGRQDLLLRHLFPKASYFLLEDPDVVARLRADPQGFLDAVKTPAILDEVQNVPEVFAFVRSRIDRRPRRAGQWLLTGSQEAPLMQGVSESMAGRAAVLATAAVVVRGRRPRSACCTAVIPRRWRVRAAARLWFSSYVQTYLERDVRAVTAVKDLATFRRFLALLASRHGQVLNKTDLAAPLGVSVPTITQWLGVLETTAQILIVPPFYENFGKRLIKSPKVYVADSGLACHLLGIETAAELAKSPFLGALFEGFMASEIVKAQVNAGPPPRALPFPRRARAGSGFPGARTRRFRGAGGVQGRAHGHAGDGGADATFGRGHEDEAPARNRGAHVSCPPGAEVRRQNIGRGARCQGAAVAGLPRRAVTTKQIYEAPIGHNHENHPHTISHCHRALVCAGDYHNHRPRR